MPPIHVLPEEKVDLRINDLRKGHGQIAERTECSNNIANFTKS